jgi:LCP family protein required for cell wall assembly
MLYRTWSAFDDVHSQSTPPPEISGDALGGDESLVIDTGPAQDAVAARQRGRSESTVPSTENPPTTAAGGTGTAVQATEGPARPGGADLGTPFADTPVTATTPATQPQATSEIATQLNTSDGINILLMGVDARPGEAIDVGVRPDSLAVLHLDESTCRILAVPRDSRVNMPGYGETKINHALAVGGIPFEQLVVEDYLGITLDHYALIDFSGVVQVVDAVGGITVDNPQAFEMSGQQFAQGRIKLDGEHALLYSRYRGGDDGDFGRVSKQQQVLRALLDEAASLDLVRMIPRMFDLLSDHFRSDLGATELLDLANTYRDSCNSASLETQTIPGDVGIMHDDMMQMDLSFVVSKPEDVRTGVEWLTGARD